MALAATVIKHDSDALTRVELNENLLFAFFSSLGNHLQPACPHVFIDMNDSLRTSLTCPTCSLIEQGGGEKRKKEEEPDKPHKKGVAVERFLLPPSVLSILSLFDQSEVVFSPPSFTVVILELDWSNKKRRVLMAPSVINLIERVGKGDISLTVSDDPELFNESGEPMVIGAPKKGKEEEAEGAPVKKKRAPAKKKPLTRDAMEKLFFQTPEKFMPSLFKEVQPLHVLSAWILPEDTLSSVEFAGLCTYSDNIFDGTFQDYLGALLIRANVASEKQTRKAYDLAGILQRGIFEEKLQDSAFKTEVSDTIGNLFFKKPYGPEETKGIADSADASLSLANHLSKTGTGADFSSLLFSTYPMAQASVKFPQAHIYHLLIDQQLQTRGIDQLFLETVQAKLLRCAKTERVAEAYIETHSQMLDFTRESPQAEYTSDNLVKKRLDTVFRQKQYEGVSFSKNK